MVAFPLVVKVVAKPLLRLLRRKPPKPPPGPPKPTKTKQETLFSLDPVWPGAGPTPWGLRRCYRGHIALQGFCKVHVGGSLGL